MLLGCRKLPPCSQERRDANHSRPCLACHLPATACLLAVRLPNGGVGLLLRCRVYDGLGRMYGVQQACLFKLRQSGPQQRPEVPAQHGRQLAEEAGGGAPSLRKLVLPQGTKPASEQQPPQRGRAGPDEAPWRLQWHGFIDMPGGGNKFLVRYDAVSRRYLALTNPSIDRYGSNPDARNVLVLVRRCC